MTKKKQLIKYLSPQMIREKKNEKYITTAVLFLLLITFTAFAFSFFPGTVDSGTSIEELGRILPNWSVLPFVCMLLSIAIFPLLVPIWWEHNMAEISMFWSLAFIIPFGLIFSYQTAIYKLLHIIVLDYVDFIILLGALFTISGGIIVRGKLRGSPIVNTVILTIGTVLASWIGTTGASMLLIRPLIRAVKERRYKIHTIIFFIFLVSNIGGSLTPIGDPPLFLGFLHGVPFFWTLRLFFPMATSVLILLALYLLIDNFLFKKEKREKSNSIDKAEDRPDSEPESLRVEGLLNFVFLAGVIGAVVVSGLISNSPLFINAISGEPKGIVLMHYHGHDLIWPWVNLLRDGVILVMAWLSIRFTKKQLREDNFFTWGPIKEVAILFVGIFITMIPAMSILQARGGEFGVTTAAQFFWATGMLSSFLDNAPTYLTYLSLASGLGAGSGVETDMGIIAQNILMAISAGSVFMGANTYIGNAPNFMVRSIAEENGIKMPSFFGYMLWSVGILIPIFILNTFIFF